MITLLVAAQFIQLKHQFCFQMLQPNAYLSLLFLYFIMFVFFVCLPLIFLSLSLRLSTMHTVAIVIGHVLCRI